MFVEFTTSDGAVLLNSDKIVAVQEETRATRACLITDDATMRINVRESFEEIKKRLRGE